MVNRKRDKNVKRFIFVTISIMIFFSIASYSFIMDTKEDLYQEKIVFLEETSKKNALLLETKIADLLNKLESIAMILSDKQDQAFAEVLEDLHQQANFNEFKRMGIIQPNGFARTSDGYLFQLQDRDYFQLAMSGISNVSNTFIDLADGKEINVFATPIIYENEIIAVLFATKETSSMSQLLSISDYEGYDDSYVVGQTGIPVTLIQSQDKKHSIENIFEEYGKENATSENYARFLEDMKTEQNSSVVLFYEGQEKQVTYTQLNVNDWYIVTHTPLDYIMATSQNLITGMMMMTACVILFLFISLCILIKYLNRNHSALQRIAYVDDVTGFSNEKQFNTQAQQLLLDHPTEKYAFIVFDVKQFKLINDLFGYHQGSSLLIHVAKQLSELIGKDECFGRISADHFCMLLKYHKNDEIIQRINHLSKMIQHFVEGYYIEVNYGIYIIDEQTFDMGMFSDRANISKNVAKSDTECNYSFYDEVARSTIIREKRLENAMAKGIADKEFEVYLQPKILLSNDKVIGSEALVRWNQKDMGMIYPNDFIPLFEKNGFIKQLDQYMFKEVCKILNSWHLDEDLNKQMISVNLSRMHLNNESLVEDFVSIAKTYHVETHLIEIELTESAIFMDEEKIISMMRHFKEEGFTLSIDDFGSGYSSLNTLKDLPVDTIKLDRSFLNEAKDNERSKVIIGCLINMIKILSLQSVAEGVETQKQLEFLKDAGCDIAQGYYYAKAMSVPQFEAYCKNRMNEMKTHSNDEGRYHNG